MKEEDEHPELVDVMLPLLDTLGLPLPVLDTEGVLQAVGEVVGERDTELVKHRVGEEDTEKVAEEHPEPVDVMLPLPEMLGLPLPVLDTEVVVQTVGVMVLVVVTVLDRQRVGV